MGHYDCKSCHAAAHEEHSVDCEWYRAVDALRRDSGQTLDSPRAGRREVQGRIDEIRDWVNGGCPEGFSGAVEGVSWLLDTVEEMHRADFKKRASEAITLLYTFGLITDKMRAHARRELSA